MENDKQDLINKIMILDDQMKAIYRRCLIITDEIKDRRLELESINDELGNLQRRRDELKQQCSDIHHIDIDMFFM